MGHNRNKMNKKRKTLITKNIEFKARIRELEDENEELKRKGDTFKRCVIFLSCASIALALALFIS